MTSSTSNLDQHNDTDDENHISVELAKKLLGSHFDFMPDEDVLEFISDLESIAKIFIKVAKSL